MAAPEETDTLHISVLEESPDSAMFVVEIRCGDPVLLAFWLRKAFFHNGEVQQTDTLLCEGGGGLRFVLRVLHRSCRLSNAHYWSPFVVALCLDALLFQYQLPAQLQHSSSLQQAMEENTLTLTRCRSPEPRRASLRGDPF